MHWIPSVQNSVASFSVDGRSLDRSFWGRIQGSFNANGLSPELFHFVLLILLFVVVLGTVAFLLNRLFFDRKEKNPGIISLHGKIKNLFDLALEQHTKIEFKLTQPEANGTKLILPCSLADYKESTLVLDAGTFYVHSGLLGREAQCFFHIESTKHPGQVQFYNFISSISGVVRRKDGTALISLELPEKLFLGQKRVHMRLVPPEPCVLGLALWPVPGCSGADMPEHPRDWGDPLFLYSKRKKENLALINLSAGGIRLSARYSAASKAGKLFEVGEYYILLFQLLNPVSKIREHYWCLVRVQNRYEDHMDNKIEMGMSFLDEGKTTEDVPMRIQWQKISPLGIEKLSNWIQQRYLEQFRRSPSIY